MPRAPKTLAIDENERFLARVAWAYHVEGLTQGAVAERLGVTRLRVNKALSEARRKGLVRISLNTHFAPCIEMEEALKARYGLREAAIAPSPERVEDTQTVVGIALGHLLSVVLADPALTQFGMSWGNTLNIATRHVDPLDRPDLEILSVMGGTTRGSDISSFEITTRLADLCNAHHSFFPAPLYAGTRASRDTIVGQAVFTDILERIRKVDALAMAVGDMSERSLLMRDALPPDVTVEALLAAGAVGDVLGTVLDASGHPIDHPINERLIGIDFTDLAAIPNVILAAGGAHKVPIIRAVLSRGLVDTFVSDEATARALLEPVSSPALEPV
ncbi:sugar-binding transcriptional regulator [Acuticoccus kandeliae]|uniref:sugar-binding transcriptional regulator n=1 Tax=Acuticoccus kandeliae TaxID=2073160 RepID=UPI000D3E5BAE|nr:sugar-binding transcriptional regulator [Acuticoccus kandeliae]